MHQLPETGEYAILQAQLKNHGKGEIMRIQDNSSLKDIEKKPRGASSVKSALSSFFADGLSKHEQEIDEYEKDVDTLRKEIEETGNKLTLEPTLPNFKQFRDLLGTLAKRISSEAYRLEKFGGTAQNPRYFEIITIINNEADKLYNLIIKENRDSIAITAKVIGIKGLVIDLVT